MAAGLDIFVDDAFRAGGSCAAPPAPETSNAGETGWKHLGTFDQTRKENMQKPGKWAGLRTYPTQQSTHVKLIFIMRNTSLAKTSACC